MENLKLLFQLYFRPAAAMSELMDKGSWFWAAVFVLVVSLVFYWTVNAKLQAVYAVPQFNFEAYQQFEDESETIETVKKREALIEEYKRQMAERPKIPLVGDRLFWFFSFEPGGFFRPLISLVVFYIPLTILLITIFGSLGNFGVIFGRDYGALSVCSLTAWTAAHLPFAIAGILLNSTQINPNIYLGFWLMSGLVFGILMVFALRVVFGANYGAAVLTVAISWLGFSLGLYVFKFISPFLFSPFLLILAYLYFGGAIAGGARGFGNAFRQQQDFKRHLHNATVNPRDADAHVQLGLIYNQRRQTDKAFGHFTKAFEIDKTEPDANYELGKIARHKGELQKAIEHFSVVLEQNDKFALSEIWREIGATYWQAKMFDEARQALETFVERRPYDPEGLYYLGKVLQAQGEMEKAQEMFEQTIESAKTSPDFRRRELRQWQKLAEKEL
jgi:cytochrome c-type biogenesis protein CcmH/NrfG